MRRSDESIKLSASGSSNFGPGSDWVGWNRTVLERLRNEIDYISLHTYVGNRTNNFEEFMGFARDLDDRIEVVKGQIRAVRVGNRIHAHHVGIAVQLHFILDAHCREHEGPLLTGALARRAEDINGIDEATGQLLGEQLGDVAKRLELQRIAAGVLKKHRCLLTHLPDKANAGFDAKQRAGSAQVCCELVPLLPLQHHAEMRHRHVVPIHRVIERLASPTGMVEMCRIEGTP